MNGAMSGSVKKWGPAGHGDFTLPRFRASLAKKYSFHPDNEPPYEEVYRSEFGRYNIERRDRFGESFHSQSASSLSLLRSRYGVVDPLQATRSDFASSFGAGTAMASQRLSMSRSASGGFGGTLRATAAFPDGTLARSSSVPTIGSLRRQEVQPATLRSGSQSVACPPSPSGAGGATLDPNSREGQLAQQQQAASRRLWAAAHGSEMYIKQQLLNNADDPKAAGAGLASTAVPGIKKALDERAQLDWQNPDWDGATLLLKAVRTSSLELVMYLVAKGADILMTDRNGRGVLHWAAVQGDAKMIEWLLNHFERMQEPPVSAVDSGGDTALHLAAYSGTLPVCRLLIRAQCDPNEPNGGGFSPIELADARRMWHVSKYLSESGLIDDDKAAALASTQKGGLQATIKPGGAAPADVLPAELRELARPCNLIRANEIQAAKKFDTKAKPKPKAKDKK